MTCQARNLNSWILTWMVDHPVVSPSTTPVTVPLSVHCKCGHITISYLFKVRLESRLTRPIRMKRDLLTLVVAPVWLLAPRIRILGSNLLNLPARSGRWELILQWWMWGSCSRFNWYLQHYLSGHISLWWWWRWRRSYNDDVLGDEGKADFHPSTDAKLAALTNKRFG